MQIRFLSEDEEFPPYRVDLYLPDYHAVIEVDGPSHNRKKDSVRDAWLEQRYYLPTLRIKAKGPWSSQTKLENTIWEFLKEQKESFQERKTNWLVALGTGYA